MNLFQLLVLLTVAVVVVSSLTLGLAQFGIIGGIVGTSFGIVLAYFILRSFNRHSARQVRRELQRLERMATTELRAILKDDFYSTPHLALSELRVRGEDLQGDLGLVVEMLTSDYEWRRKVGELCLLIISSDLWEKLRGDCKYRFDDPPNVRREKVSAFRFILDNLNNPS